jgi:hypothetical protein
MIRRNQIFIETDEEANEKNVDYVENDEKLDTDDSRLLKVQ